MNQREVIEKSHSRDKILGSYFGGYEELYLLRCNSV